MKQEPKQLKEEKERLEVSGLSGAGLVVACSVSGESWDASAGTRAPKRKKGNQKRHPGLFSEEWQEYYESYLAHF